MKRILKWIGIVMGVVIALLMLAGGIIYLAFPSYTVTATRIVAASPEEAYNAFMDYDHWHEYFDFDELYPPDGEVSVGTEFGYSGSEGDMAIEVLELVPGEIVRFDMKSDTIDAEFILEFEPIDTTTTRVTASNIFSSTGFLRVMIVVYSATGEVNRYYGNMIENVERVALEKYQ